MVPSSKLPVLSSTVRKLFTSTPSTVPSIVIEPGVLPAVDTLNVTVSLSPPDKVRPPPARAGSIDQIQPEGDEKLTRVESSCKPTSTADSPAAVYSCSWTYFAAFPG